MPEGSSDLPESTTGRRMAFFSVLLRMEFTCARSVTTAAVVSYTAFPPLPRKTGRFISVALVWELPPPDVIRHPACEARTFLVWTLSSVPESTTGRRMAFFSVLLRMEFTCARSVTTAAVVSYTAFPPLPRKTGRFISVALVWELPPPDVIRHPACEARTFLSLKPFVCPAAITWPGCAPAILTQVYRLVKLEFSWSPMSFTWKSIQMHLPQN